MHYYPFHIGDYTLNTRHLSLMEDLAYRRLLDLYYQNDGFLCGNAEYLARKVAMPDEEDAVDGVLLEFFDCIDPDDTDLDMPTWKNPRADRVIADYRDKLEKASRAGKASGIARSKHVEQSLNGRSTDVEPTNNQEPRTSNQEPRTKNQQKRENHAAGAAGSLPDGFLEFWSAYGKNTKKAKAATRWRNMPALDRMDAMAGVAAYVAATPDKAFRRDAVTWLHQRGWEDEIVVSNGAKAAAAKEPEHPRGMPIPYDSPLTPCRCGMCDKARKRKEVV